MARPALILVLLAHAALATAAPPPAELGTLFHTPEERARLDRLRRGEPAEPVERTAREPRTPAVTGYVKRSDGRNTVWVDGTPVATRNDPRNFDPKVVVPRPVEAAPKAPSPKGTDARGSGKKDPDPKGSEAASAGTKAPGPPPSLPARTAEPAKR